MKQNNTLIQMLHTYYIKYNRPDCSKTAEAIFYYLIDTYFPVELLPY